MPATAVLVVRHGQSTWNAAGRWQGQADPPLTPLGEAQARAAADALGSHPIELVVSSDQQRAAATAALIADVLAGGEPRCSIDERLRETDAGPWTGLTRVEIEARWPGMLIEGRRPAGFEPWEAVARRATAALLALHAGAPGASALAVTHAGVIRAIERSLGVDEGVVPNLGGRRLVVDGDHLCLGERVLLIDPSVVTVTAPTQL